MGKVFCQKIYSNWCLVQYRFSTFGDTQTTLRKNHRTYTCMTSLGKTVQCIIDVHKLGAWCKVFGDLGKHCLSPEPSSRILCVSQMLGRINLQLPRLLKSQTTLYQNLLFWLRYTRLFPDFCTCFDDCFGTLGIALKGLEIMNWYQESPLWMSLNV